MAGKFSGLATSDAPARMTVIHPSTGEPLKRNDTGEECWIEAHPSDGKRGAAIDAELLTRRLRRRVQGTITANEVEKGTVAKLAMLTTGWSLALLDGTPIDVPYSEEDAIELYSMDNGRWLRNQLATFVGELGNFQPTLPGTS